MASAVIEARFDAIGRFSHSYAINHAFGPNDLAHMLAVHSGHPRASILALLAYSLLGSAAMLLVLARRFRTGPTFPLLAGPFVIHYSIAYGFVEFDVGVPLMFALIGWLSLAAIASRSWRSRIAWACVLAALLQTLFFAHAILCLFCLGIVVFFVGRIAPRSWAIASAATLAMLPAVVSTAVWKLGRRGDRGQAQWLRWYYQLGYLPEFPTRLRDLFTADHRMLIGPSVGPWLAASTVMSAAVACGVLWFRRPPTPPAFDASASATTWSFFIASALTVGFAPPDLPPFSNLYQRFVFALLISVALLVCARGGRSAASRWLVYPLVLLNLAVGVAWFEHVFSFRHAARDLNTLATSMSLGGIGACVIADTRWRGDPLALTHAPDLLTVFGDAVVQSSLYDFPYTRVGRGPALAGVPWQTPIYSSVAAFSPFANGFDWILVHRSVSQEDRVALGAIAAERAEHGDWAIYSIRPTTQPTITGTTP